MHANFEKFMKYPVDTVSAFGHEKLKSIKIASLWRYKL